MPKRKPYEFVVDEVTGCFNFISTKGLVKDAGRTITIQRFIYEQCFGEVPEGKMVFRKCGNNKCINPEHLDLITLEEQAAQLPKKYLSKPLDFEVDPINGCFNCTSHAPNSDGYPQIGINGKRQKVHKFVYEQMFGEIPKGLVVRHKCDNTYCINPEHLELGTQYQNVQDMVERGRVAHLKGELHGNAKLTGDDVRYIKDALARGETGKSLAKRFNVTETTISRIKRGISWSHIS